MVQQMMPMDIEGTAETVASNRKQIKHIGKLKESGANVAVVFRTIPDSPNNCLVFGPKFLDDTNHNAFMKTLETYKDTLGKDSTLMLSTDSDFYKYLKSIDGTQ